MENYAETEKHRQILDGIETEALLYVRLEQEPSEDTEYVRLSILTDEMLAYDAEMFSFRERPASLDEYRPYFASFIVPVEDKSANDLRSLGSEWLCAQFVEGKENEENRTEGMALDGTLATSASPVCYLEKRLLVFKDRKVDQALLDKISSTYDPSRFTAASNKAVEDALKDAWAGDFPCTIDIYNVGHGNADCIWGEDHKILYDVGYNYRSLPGPRKGKFQKAATAIRRLKPDCVILSHWDLDHFIGCAYARQELFHKKWIAPRLVSGRDDQATPNAVRLAQYLDILGSLLLVDRDQSDQLIATVPCQAGVEMKLWLGSRTSMLTPRNREGLLIEILDKNRSYPHVLLAGDVPYRCMPDILADPIDFMHVPHHCSKMELPRLKAMPGGGTCAVISTNRTKRGQLNCGADHYDTLKTKFAAVVATIEHSPRDDAANLSVEINYAEKTYRFR